MRVPCVAACLLLVVSASPEEEQLLQSLLRDYSATSRPVQHVHDTLTVNLSYTLVDVDLVDLDSNDISVQGWVNLQWKDAQLRWNVSQHSNIKSLHIPIESIWKPDIKIYNGLEASMDPTLAIVYSDGSVLWVPPMKSGLKCTLKPLWYPFDEQNCSIIFGSWTLDVSKMDLRVGTPSPPEFHENKEWKLVSLEQRRLEKIYDCCVEAYPSVETQIVIRRKGCKSFMNKALPVASMSIFGLLTMMIPATRAEIRLLVVTLILSSTMVVTDFTDAPESINILSMFNAQTILTLTALFLCNCIHLAILRGGVSSSLLEKLAGLVSNDEKSENLISNVEQRYHRTLDTLFTIPLTFLLISSVALFVMLPCFYR